MSRRRNALAVGLVAMILVASGCAGGEVGGDGGGGGGGGGEIAVAAVWSDAEQQNFEAVMDAFTQETGIETTYRSAEDLGTYLGTQIEGGDPPDVAMIPQPGLMADLAAEDALVELGEEAAANLEANYAPIWTELGSVDGTLYGVYFKVASKATWWYNTAIFEQAGVQPPATWDEMLQAAKTVNASGVPWMSIGAAEAWPLTDIFENVYLQVAGPEKYDQLAAHEIPWTDPSVIEALNVLRELFQDDQNFPGGREGALRDDFTTSVTNAFSDPPESATVYEGDFVAGTIAAETDAAVGQEANFFPFPVVQGEGGVVGAGDVGVALTDSEEAQQFLAYLATPEAAEVWASKGGFISPNNNLDPSVYPDEISRRIAEGVIAAAEGGSFRFDLSDLQPAEFGATAGRGMWQRMQDFFRTLDVRAVAQDLEKDAAKAFGG
jgi:alpha-glucoside transport system substrate-binding protein